MLNRLHLSIAHDHVRFAAKNGRHELGDVVGAVLVVRVRVDDDVCTQLQGGIEAGLESLRQAFVVRKANDVVDSVAACHVHRTIGRTVVDNEPLDAVEAIQMPG